MSAFSLEAYMEDERGRVEAALERAVAWIREVVPQGVADAVAHGVLSGGKRLRPILCVSAYRACGGEVREAAYDLGAAPELIHAYSLMHDDLPCMDDAELRRGQPTTHRVHGERRATVAGAALIPAAALQALRAATALGRDEGQARDMARTLLEAAGAGGMVGGQWLDLLGEGRTLGAEDLDALHRRKTGALLTASLIMGAQAAGAEDRALEGLERYGRSVGLAFQIADDILDATSSAEALGKHPSDEDLDKSTYVSSYGLAEARRRAREEVHRAREGLARSGLEAPALDALAEYIVERRR